MDDRDPGRGRLGPSGRVLAEALVVAGLWLLFAGSLATDEVMAAMLVGAGSALGAAALRRFVGQRSSGVVRGWVRMGPRIVVGMVVDSVLVTADLVRAAAGAPRRSQLHAVPFEVGDDGAADVGRRVLTTVALTLQPNSIVVGFDRERQVVLVHELVPRPDHPAVPSDLATRS